MSSPFRLYWRRALCQCPKEFLRSLFSPLRLAAANAAVMYLRPCGAAESRALEFLHFLSSKLGYGLATQDANMIFQCRMMQRAVRWLGR
jgi:hypothetical protein